MKGLRIDMSKDGVLLDLQTLVEGTNAQVQNIMVNISTESPAPIFEGRGTNLLQDFARTGFVSRVFTQHRANFAALDTLYFCKAFNSEKSALSDIDLTAPLTNTGDLIFTLEVRFSDGTILANPLSL
jgi:hypothetical protein